MKNYTLEKVVPSYVFSEQDRLRFKNEIAQIQESPYQNFESFASSAFEVTRRLLPKDLFNKVIDMRRNFFNRGCLVIENTPIDENLIETPSSPIWRDQKKSYASEAIITGIGQLLGEIYGYRGEKNGQLIHNNYPTRSGAVSISNEGSKVVLPMHNEDIHVYPFSPSFLMLGCIRQGMATNVYTYVLSISEIINEFTADELSILRSPNFYIEAPESFDADSPSSNLIPIISGPEDLPQISVEFTDSRGISKDARRTLEKFKEVCLASPALKKVVLKTGDILILDNRKTLHGRSNFKANFDGTDRWCQRIFIKSGDLWDWRDKFTHSRILEF